MPLAAKQSLPLQQPHFSLLPHTCQRRHTEITASHKSTHYGIRKDLLLQGMHGCREEATARVEESGRCRLSSVQQSTLLEAETSRPHSPLWRWRTISSVGFTPKESLILGVIHAARRRDNARAATTIFFEPRARPPTFFSRYGKKSFLLTFLSSSGQCSHHRPPRRR